MKYENLNIDAMEIYRKTKNVALTQKAASIEFKLKEYSFSLNSINELEEKLSTSSDNIEKFFCTDQIKMKKERVSILEKEIDALLQELGGVL